MTEQNETPKQDYHYQVDQQVSVNSFIEIDLDGESVRFQVTSRYGASVDKIFKTANTAIEAYKALRELHPRPVATIPSEPVRKPIADDGSELPPVYLGKAGKLEFESKGEKHWFKIMDATYASGRKGTKYGVTVWPEVLEGAGLNIAQGQPMPDVTGWTFEYIENDKGYPAKVYRIFPPK